MPKPLPGSHPNFFQKYIDQVPEDDLLLAFNNQLKILKPFFNLISEEKSKHAYALGKWTIKGVLQHIIDAERIFNYRALCFARGETLPLPGFDENIYAENSNADNRKWKDLVEEFIVVRNSTELLYNSFEKDIFNRSGISNNNSTSISSLGFITLGHFYHHKKIIEERYL